MVAAYVCRTDFAVFPFEPSSGTDVPQIYHKRMVMDDGPTIMGGYRYTLVVLTAINAREYADPAHRAVRHQYSSQRAP